MTQLTEHFTLEELTASSTAQRLGINNTPPAFMLPRLQLVAAGLERIRALLGGKPMHIDSGYRCHLLNDAVRGARDSAHMDGYAADFTCAAFGAPFDIVKAIAASDIEFDKCICEGTWCHISFAPELRREIMTAHFGPHGTTYTAGV